MILARCDDAHSGRARFSCNPCCSLGGIPGVRGELPSVLLFTVWQVANFSSPATRSKKVRTPRKKKKSVSIEQPNLADERGAGKNCSTQLAPPGSSWRGHLRQAARKTPLREVVQTPTRHVSWRRGERLPYLAWSCCSVCAPGPEFVRAARAAHTDDDEWSCPTTVCSTCNTQTRQIRRERALIDLKRPPTPTPTPCLRYPRRCGSRKAHPKHRGLPVWRVSPRHFPRLYCNYRVVCAAHHHLPLPLQLGGSLSLQGWRSVAGTRLAATPPLSLRLLRVDPLFYFRSLGAWWCVSSEKT